MGFFAELRERVQHVGDTLVCSQVVEMVTDYVEGAMPASQRKRFERHLRTCPDCVAYVEQCRHAVEVLHEVPPAPPEGDTRESLLAMFREFRADGAPAADAAEGDGRGEGGGPGDTPGERPSV